MCGGRGVGFEDSLAPADGFLLCVSFLIFYRASRGSDPRSDSLRDRAFITFGSSREFPWGSDEGLGGLLGY